MVKKSPPSSHWSRWRPRAAKPGELHAAVQAMVDDDAFDTDERCTVIEDLAILADLAPSHT
ncbi:Uncharacterised protein [Mycobacterium xenopi]|uniref:Uncharacterized protein n=1 Tax=Mycobacterium xenopi TaxID=1789 RepID=A0AAD1M3D0_MYCXE|nr:hypothetical protein I552_6803 [Mycobacterium xenopi 3993]BBU24321.1 hypothetical protein MYXE_41110 [Mycobacterium xenopi]SPX90376.1 Uncharacterised protein [Mycobacterium xenopi]